MMLHYLGWIAFIALGVMIGFVSLLVFGLAVEATEGREGAVRRGVEWPGVAGIVLAFAIVIIGFCKLI